MLYIMKKVHNHSLKISNPFKELQNFYFEMLKCFVRVEHYIFLSFLIIATNGTSLNFRETSFGIFNFNISFATIKF